MRLLNTHTLQLEEFFTEVIKSRDMRYDILSHTWTLGEELSYADWIVLTDDPDSAKAATLRTKSGYKKIRGFVHAVRARNGCDYVWIDTIGINKDSSAELSEAINSMYNWYRDADVCYAYLTDVSSTDDIKAASSEFQYSRWFTRGWTLQELIAPPEVQFFNSAWECITSRSESQLLLSQITGVPFMHRLGPNSQALISVAQIISWASRRETTRIEDMSYCLLGLLGVNMPLLYGEGRKAFVRLQLEIIKTKRDHSIFVWYEHGFITNPFQMTALARSPVDFADSAHMCTSSTAACPDEESRHMHRDVQEVLYSVKLDQPYDYTNFGLRIALPLFTCHELPPCSRGEDRCDQPCKLALLNARTVKKDDVLLVLLHVKRGRDNKYRTIRNHSKWRLVSYRQIRDILTKQPRVATQMLLN